MVHPTFLSNFAANVSKEFGNALAGPPSVRPGGVQMDHYKGLASALATRFVPFAKESYRPTEFVYGFIPLGNNVLPYLFFQFAVLDMKGRNVPGVGNFGAVLRAAIPETYVAPYADWKHRLLPLSALSGADASASKVFKARVGWNPLLEAVNGDKAAVKALGSPSYSSRVGDFKVAMDSQRLSGFVQLAPYKGHTLMTLESTPGLRAAVDRPYYDLKDHHDALLKVAIHVLAHPQPGEEIGQLFLTESNAAMMDLMIKHVGAAAATASAP